MHRGEISRRIKNIIVILCEQKDFITVGDIANKLSVSTKTITRELARIDKLLAKYNVFLEKKQGVGICITGNAAAIGNLKKAFTNAPEIIAYEPKERAHFLIARLLQNQEPIKLFELSNQLNVAESTISTDLDKLDAWFTNHSLTLIRKPGLGVYITGREKDIRKAILHYIYENINEADLVEVLHELLSHNTAENSSQIQSEKRLLNLVDTQILAKLEIVIHNVETEYKFKLSDNAYVALLIHLALAIQRMQQHEQITFDDAFLQEISTKHEFTISKKIAAGIKKIFNLDVPVEEMGYITMHLLGTRNLYYTGATPFIPNFQLVQIAKKIIKIAQAETGQKLEHNDKLLIGLVNHLGPSISRLHMGMEIRNPLLDDIKEEYAPLMQLSKICCSAVLSPIVNKPIPESESAYIAMHLGAALEDINLKKRQQTYYHAAIACPTGLGSSKLLAARLKHEFTNIEITAVISALRINAETLIKQQIDFIISTVPIPATSIPVIVINPLLKNNDIEIINKFLAVFKQKNHHDFLPLIAKTSLTENLPHLIQYQNSIFQILNNFIFDDLAKSLSIAEIIEFISKKISSDKTTANNIAAALLQRERYGSTLLYEQQIILLHCQAAVAQTHFAVIRSKNGIAAVSDDTHNNFIAAVIMIIPDGCADEAREAMGTISESLIDNWLFSATIINNSATEIQSILENILTKFLKEKTKLLLN